MGAQVFAFPAGPPHLMLSGVDVVRVLSAELFQETTEARLVAMHGGLAERCHAVWTDLAAALAALPRPIETVLVLGTRPGANGVPSGIRCSFLALGRGPDAASAAEDGKRALAELRSLLWSNLSYAELRSIDDPGDLEQLAGVLRLPHVVEIRRRLEEVSIGVGGLPVPGYKPPAPRRKRKDEVSEIPHLFPWVPADDPWRRLAEVLLEAGGAAALVVHARGFGAAPPDAHAALLRTVAAIESLSTGQSRPIPPVETILFHALDALRMETLARLAYFEGPLLAARVFVATEREPSGALLSTVLGSVDDASVRAEESRTHQFFRGGALVVPVTTEELLAPLDTPTFDLLFGPREASAIWRTPMPTDADLPGLPIVRARTAVALGRSGDDSPLGANVHRGSRTPIALDGPTRFRHAYIVGQTGTGKSTLLLRMVLHDLEHGRGVALLDPHGTLVEDVLHRMPPSREKDVLLLDLTDADRPVGFNMLCIPESDPVQYRFLRDLIIDDLYAYIERTYTRDTMGPIFESHFRGMLALLLGTEPPTPPRIPNLIVFRSLYSDAALRMRLAAEVKGRDQVVDAFVAEAQRVAGDASLANIAPYITSKFVRFISDVRLRNITCQPRTLDLEEIVNDRRVLLVNLGRGRFGDYAAGLVASQLVSRFRYEVMKRGSGGAAKPFHLYVDEFQMCADQRFGELLAEARKFGLSITLAHQYARQLPEGVLHAILGNVGTVVAFRVGPHDAELLEPMFAPHFGTRDLASLANYRAYVRSTGSLGTTPFSLETSPPDVMPDDDRADRIRASSRARYGRDASEVEEEVAAALVAFSGEELRRQALATLEKIERALKAGEE